LSDNMVIFLRRCALFFFDGRQHGFIKNLTAISHQAASTSPYRSAMKHKYLDIALALVILGIAVLGVSMTMIHSQTKEMLGIVFGGVLVQAGIAAFAIDWSKARKTARRRS
jgi:hypothetical protein